MLSEQGGKDVVSESGDENLAQEMSNVEQGINYAVKEAAAQEQARAEAKAAARGAQASPADAEDVVEPEDEEGGYFRALGVANHATDAELKKAYRRKIIQWCATAPSRRSCVVA
jgi:hypothetical protein